MKNTVRFLSGAIISHAITFQAALSQSATNNVPGQMLGKAASPFIAVSPAPSPATAPTNSPTLPNSHYLPGIVYEPGVYDRALTSTEVAAVYTAGCAGKCKRDTDNDGLIDLQEGWLGTNPLNPDTDGDEVFFYHTDPKH